MPQRNIQDEEMMLRYRKFTPKRKKHFKMSKRNIQDKEMMLRSKEFSGTFLLTPPPIPPATEDQFQEAVDPDTQGEKRPRVPGEQETAQNLDGFERRDGSAIKESERPRRVKRPVNKFV